MVLVSSHSNGAIWLTCDCGHVSKGLPPLTIVSSDQTWMMQCTACKIDWVIFYVGYSARRLKEIVPVCEANIPAAGRAKAKKKKEEKDAAQIEPLAVASRATIDNNNNQL